MSIIIIVLTGLMIAGLCRSLVHTLLHHYGAFAELFGITNHQWWNPAISHTNKKTRMVQFSDAFHTFNTIELGAIYFVVSYLLSVITELMFFIDGWILVLVFIGIYLVVLLWTTYLWFNLGYNKLWR